MYMKGWRRVKSAFVDLKKIIVHSLFSFYIYMCVYTRTHTPPHGLKYGPIQIQIGRLVSESADSDTNPVL